VWDVDAASYNVSEQIQVSSLIDIHLFILLYFLVSEFCFLIPDFLDVDAASHNASEQIQVERERDLY